ncbi:hypothetical protein ASC78_02650 [Variovorax sp. Root318D1]|uniref:hypothetical protein n=1 Tax=Variovorax sp. Root318D1 TaxID=1736513 RepID=UPI0006FF10D5|nr:hypothetical protein [Variovorax sp. Root318D1]KQU86500.1 hypothetical protein ASC78_02650 [Variovorax sp. Root318D1]
MGWLDIVGPIVGVVVMGSVILVTSMLARSALSTESLHAKEEKVWEQLKVQGLRAEADILVLARPSNRLVVWRNGSPSMAAAELRVRYRDEAGVTHEASVKTFIDEELLANFSIGKKVAIVYTDDDPERIAIDRERAQVAFVTL